MIYGREHLKLVADQFVDLMASFTVSKIHPFFLGGSAGLGMDAADIDIFVSAQDEDYSTLCDQLKGDGYIPHGCAGQYRDFATFRKGDLNIIVINDEESYTARKGAFEICRYITGVMHITLSKEDRKMIHKIAAGEYHAPYPNERSTA